jgi:hypothetical protein
VLARLLETLVRLFELVGALAVLPDEPRVFESDRHLIGESPERGHLSLEMRARPHARLDVERADCVPIGREDRNARDRFEHHLVHRGVNSAHARVLRR